MRARGLILTSVIAASILAGCAPTANTAGTPASRTTYVAVIDNMGGKTVYPVRGGVRDRVHAIRTSRSDWRPGSHPNDSSPPIHPPEAYIQCVTWRATEASSGAEVCGVSCSDGTHYRMSCGADIFADGFDKEWKE